MFPNPDRDARDSDDLDLAGFEEKVIDSLWLDVPHFVRAVDSGRVSVYRSDTLPRSDFLVATVVSELTARGWSNNAALTIYNICASEPIPPEFDQFIDLAPSRDSKTQNGPDTTIIGPRWDLLRQHLPFLREILALELKWRKRPAIVKRLRARIRELESRARV